jgi:hypothetical protein
MIVMKRYTGKILIATGLLLLVVLFSWEVFSQEKSSGPSQLNLKSAQIIEVRRNIPLSDSEPVIRDYYVNSGELDGIKAGSVYQVLRRVPVKDNPAGQTFAEVTIPVGKIKIVFSSSKVSVGRFIEDKLKDNPVLEQNSVINGDIVDITKPLIDTKKSSVKSS